MFQESQETHEFRVSQESRESATAPEAPMTLHPQDSVTVHYPSGYRHVVPSYNGNAAALDSVGRDRVRDGEGVVLEIEVVPLQAHDLAAAQPVEQAKIDGQLQPGALGQTHTLHRFLRRVKAADEFLRLGPLVVGDVFPDQAVIDGAFQRRVDVGVIPCDRRSFLGGFPVRRVAQTFLFVEFFEVQRTQFGQCDPFLLEIGPQPSSLRVSSCSTGPSSRSFNP